MYMYIERERDVFNIRMHTHILTWIWDCLYWVAPLVQCYLFSGGALVFYVFLRGTLSPFSMFLVFSTFFFL